MNGQQKQNKTSATGNTANAGGKVAKPTTESKVPNVEVSPGVDDVVQSEKKTTGDLVTSPVRIHPHTERLYQTIATYEQTHSLDTIPDPKAAGSAIGILANSISSTLGSTPEIFTAEWKIIVDFFERNKEGLTSSRYFYRYLPSAHMTAKDQLLFSAIVEFIMEVIKKPSKALLQQNISIDEIVRNGSRLFATERARANLNLVIESL